MAWGTLASWVLVFGAIGAAIGSSKGQTGTGLILGALLGIIGIIILLFMKPRPQTCLAGHTSNVTGWHPDPYHRHELRYFDGISWRDDVCDAGFVSRDTLRAHRLQFCHGQLTSSQDPGEDAGRLANPKRLQPQPSELAMPVDPDHPLQHQQASHLRKWLRCPCPS